MKFNYVSYCRTTPRTYTNNSNNSNNDNLLWIVRRINRAVQPRERIVSIRRERVMMYYPARTAQARVTLSSR